MKTENLIEKAKDARKLSYSPYSKFAVGAALLCKDGQVIAGANIENASYPLCICAERNALYSAMLRGYKKSDFLALAIVADTPEACAPCGACRQVISELFPKEGEIIMANLKGAVVKSNIAKLLPFAFSEEDLK
ncbi:MAG: cytidine deaminase [Erysipelotrichaceae bacterium]|jgi:cytidine deaminase|nr:cytidine deaminase [Erysipelotrichaceae bacterium]